MCTYIFDTFGQILRSLIAGFYGRLCLVLLETAKLFSKVTVPLCILMYLTFTILIFLFVPCANNNNNNNACSHFSLAFYYRNFQIYTKIERIGKGAFTVPITHLQKLMVTWLILV